MVISKQLN